jgi:KDO transferase-3
VTPLEEFLSNRDSRDTASLVEWMYRHLPTPLARLGERGLLRRHMRSIMPRVSFSRNDDGGWTIRHRAETIARSRPLEQLVGMIDKPVTIVATGPSAKDHDWETLRDGGRFVIAVAGAPTLLKSVNLRPDLFVVSDSRFARRGAAHFGNAGGVPLVTVLRAASIHAIESRNELSSRPFALIEQINSWYGLPRLTPEALMALNLRSGSPFRFPERPDPHYRCGWSTIPEHGYFSATTVAFVALQIAVRLGARDIEIIGMDLSSAPRAYDEGKEPLPNSLEAHFKPVILPSFEIMRESLKGTGVSVRNLSPVCPLPRTLFAS